jgi:hypothetical protein
VNLVSDFIVFFIAGTILVYEYSESEKNSAIKAKVAAQAQLDYDQRINDKFDDLDMKILVLSDRVLELERIVQASSNNKNLVGKVHILILVILSVYVIMLLFSFCFAGC